MGLFDIFRTNKRVSYRQAENDLRILRDCEKILISTIDEEAFYSRLELFEKTINHLCTLNVKTTGVSPFQLKTAFYKDKQELIDNFIARCPRKNPYSDSYFAGMEKIEAAWSVLTNLRIYQGEQVDQFEELCRRNIDNYNMMNAFDLDIAPDYPIPHHAPAYVRLTMLYEKQKKYKEAIDICVEAIKNGAYNDHSKGKMYGRLARLIRKSGIEVNADIIKLTVMQ